MKVSKTIIFLTAGLIVGSTVWNGCYTRLATSSDNIVSEAESDTTITNQITAINDVTQSLFINDPWVVGPFLPFHVSPPLVRKHFQKKNAVPAYRPLFSTGTPSVSSGAASQASTPHREAGYQRSSSPDPGSSRSAESTPNRTSPSPAVTPSPAVPTTRAPATSAPAPSTPPANSRAGGATRSGR